MTEIEKFRERCQDAVRGIGRSRKEEAARPVVRVIRRICDERGILHDFPKD